MILKLRINNVLVYRINFKEEKLEELLDQDRCQMLAELEKTLEVDELNVSKYLKVLGMI